MVKPERVECHVGLSAPSVWLTVYGAATLWGRLRGAVALCDFHGVDFALFVVARATNERGVRLSPGVLFTVRARVFRFACRFLPPLSVVGARQKRQLSPEARKLAIENAAKARQVKKAGAGLHSDSANRP